MRDALTAQQLREIFDYNPETGVFIWRVSRGSAKSGNEAGSPNNQGYIQIKIFGAHYKTHRLAWLYTHGTWPHGDIDHINQNKSDNRMCNLRQATRSENTQNTNIKLSNTSGHKGVCWHKKNKKWVAKITINYSIHYIGSYSEIDDAVAARKKAERQMHPFAAQEH